MKNYNIIDEDLLDVGDNSEEEKSRSKKLIKYIKIILCAIMGEGFLYASHKGSKEKEVNTDYLSRY